MNYCFNVLLKSIKINTIDSYENQNMYLLQTAFSWKIRSSKKHEKHGR